MLVGKDGSFIEENYWGSSMNLLSHHLLAQQNRTTTFLVNLYDSVIWCPRIQTNIDCIRMQSDTQMPKSRRDELHELQKDRPQGRSVAITERDSPPLNCCGIWRLIIARCT
jgi:hypothetical protein